MSIDMCDSEPSVDIFTIDTYFRNSLTFALCDADNLAAEEMKYVSDYLATLDERQSIFVYHIMENILYTTVCHNKGHMVHDKYDFICDLLNIYILPHYAYTEYTIKYISTDLPIYRRIERIIYHLKHAVHYYKKVDICNKLISRHNCNGVEFSHVPSRYKSGMQKIDNVWKRVVFLRWSMCNTAFWLPHHMNYDDLLSKVGNGEYVTDIVKLYGYFLNHHDYSLHNNKCNIPRLLIKCFGLVCNSDNSICEYFDIDNVTISSHETNDVSINVETLIYEVINHQCVDTSYREWVEQFYPSIDFEEYKDNPDFPTKEQYIHKFILPNLDGIIPSRQKSARK